MYLLLCDPQDTVAIWTYKGLKQRGVAPLHVIHARELLNARCAHTLGATGVSVEFNLEGYGRIHSDDIKGILNRLLWLPFDYFLQAHPNDRDYALQECYAFFASWMHSLSAPVLNPATVSGLSGRWYTPFEWALLAAQTGLNISTYHMSNRTQFVDMRPDPTAHHQKLLVIGQCVVGPEVPAWVKSACVQLAKRTDLPLLGIHLVELPNDKWSFAGATPCPDLRTGDKQGLDVLADILLHPLPRSST